MGLGPGGRACHENLLYVQLMPKGDLVLAKIAEVEEKTTGGILLPTSAQKRPTSGKQCTQAHTASAPMALQ